MGNSLGKAEQGCFPERFEFLVGKYACLLNTCFFIIPNKYTFMRVALAGKCQAVPIAVANTPTACTKEDVYSLVKLDIWQIVVGHAQNRPNEKVLLFFFGLESWPHALRDRIFGSSSGYVFGSKSTPGLVV